MFCKYSPYQPHVMLYISTTCIYPWMSDLEIIIDKKYECHKNLYCAKNIHK